MYNAEQKQEYINTELIEKNKTSLINYFLRISKKEEEHNKDIVDMNIDELKDTIVSLRIRREESMRHLLSFMRAYARWAAINKKTNNMVLGSVRPELFISHETTRDKMIKDPQHLRLILNNALNTTDYENKSKIITLVFMLLYSGMDLSDIQKLKKNDIDKTTREIILDGDKRLKINSEISDEVIKLWDECSEMTYVERKSNATGTASKKVVSDYLESRLVDNEYLIRPIVNNTPDKDRVYNLNTLRKIVSSVFTKENNITLKNIAFSGIFYNIYTLEKNGVIITPETFAEYFNISYKTRDELHVKTRKWRVDYEDWKIAFGYANKLSKGNDIL